MELSGELSSREIKQLLRNEIENLEQSKDMLMRDIESHQENIEEVMSLFFSNEALGERSSSI